MQPHQVVGVVDGDFSDGGTAGVRQVGVTVVDRESAETWKIAQRILYFFSCYICWTDLGSFFSLYLHMCFFCFLVYYLSSIILLDQWKLVM